MSTAFEWLSSDRFSWVDSSFQTRHSATNTGFDLSLIADVATSATMARVDTVITHNLGYTSSHFLTLSLTFSHFQKMPITSKSICLTSKRISKPPVALAGGGE